MKNVQNKSILLSWSTAQHLKSMIGHSPWGHKSKNGKRDWGIKIAKRASKNFII